MGLWSIGMTIGRGAYHRLIFLVPSTPDQLRGFDSLRLHYVPNQICYTVTPVVGIVQPLIWLGISYNLRPLGVSACSQGDGMYIDYLAGGIWQARIYVDYLWQAEEILDWLERVGEPVIRLVIRPY